MTPRSRPTGTLAAADRLGLGQTEKPQAKGGWADELAREDDSNAFSIGHGRCALTSSISPGWHLCSSGRQTEDRDGVIAFTGFQFCRREVGTIRRVREVLGLEAQSRGYPVCPAAFA